MAVYISYGSMALFHFVTTGKYYTESYLSMVFTSEPFALTNLGTWRNHYVNHVLEQLRREYLFSPEWDRIFESSWDEYDTLEAARALAGYQRLWWQDDMERIQSKLTIHREECYKPLSAENQPLGPLAIQMDLHLGVDEQDRLYPWRSIMSNWMKFQELCNIGNEDESGLYVSLSSTQRSSYQILKDWWEGIYHTKELIAVTKEFIEKRREDKDYMPPEKEVYAAMLADKSLYHSFCLELFLDEFHPVKWEPYTGQSSVAAIQLNRYKAARYAGLQKLACASVSRWHEKASMMQESMRARPYPSLLLNEGKRTEYGRHCMPMYLWDAINEKTVLVSELGPVWPAYTCISHTWGRWRLQNADATITGVPWKVPENKLYDVRDLPAKFKKLGKPYIWFDLFCIPQDDSPEKDIEIARQAAIFGNCEQSIAWMFDVEGWQGTENALNWIAAKYFKHTVRNEVPLALDQIVQQCLGEANSTPTDLYRLNTEHVQMMSQCEDVQNDQGKYHDAILPKWFSSLWTLQEAALCPDMLLCSRDFEFLRDGSGCPIALSFLLTDLTGIFPYVLCNFDESDTFIPPSQYHDVVLKKSAAEWEQFTDCNSEWPESAINLCGFASMIRISGNVCTSSPIDVLLSANFRECTGSRAPAIMSAIGVTDWFIDQIAERAASSKLEMEELVLGCYPIAFVKEAARRFGAVFYSTLPAHHGSRPSRNATSNWSEAEALGSMLPFTRGTDLYSIPLSEGSLLGLPLTDHVAVASWKLTPNGTVHIHSAGVFASSHRRSPRSDHLDHTHIKWRPPRTAAEAPQRDFLYHPGGHFIEVNNLHQTLQQIAVRESQLAGLEDGTGALRVYAVCLWTSGRYQYGMLLLGPAERAGPRVSGGTRYLTKIGMYTCDHVNIPPSRNINWVVL